jgi:hypothetical protein
VPDERPVDLHEVDRQLLQMSERPVPHAEIVQRKLTPELFELLGEDADVVDALDRGSLADLEDETRRVDRGGGKPLRHDLGEAPVGQRSRGDIDPDVEPTSGLAVLLDQVAGAS